MLIANLRESIAVLCDHQYYEGWCILLLKDHQEHLARLPVERQRRLYDDVIDVAGAIDRAFHPVRLNFENLGNEMHHIHWHIIPRYSWDPEPKKPIWISPPRGVPDRL